MGSDHKRQGRLWIVGVILATTATVALVVCTRPISALGRAEQGDESHAASTYNPYPSGNPPIRLKL